MRPIPKVTDSPIPMGIPIDFPTSLDTAAARYACLAAGVLEYACLAISCTPSPAVITNELNLPPHVTLKTIFGVDAGIIYLKENLLEYLWENL